MSITRFMANKDNRPVTSTSSARISYFATPTELEDPVFESVDMSRDNIRRHVRQERNSLSAEEQNQLAVLLNYIFFPYIIILNISYCNSFIWIFNIEHWILEILHF